MRGNRTVFLSVLGISWLWFFGSMLVTQFPNLSKNVLGGSEHVVTLLLIVFSVGIGAGSLLCERLSGHKIEIGLVPFGSIGLTLFGIDLYFALNVGAPPTAMGIAEFLRASGTWRVLADLFLIGVFGGFYIVPLYALIQSRSEPDERARVIAANNILNALFMVLAALLAIAVLDWAGLGIPELFLIVSLLNLAVNGYIFTIVPEFSMRFIIWLLGHTLYRVEHRNLEAIPDEGAALLVCNHVSFVDALLLGGAIRRPVRFVMYYRIYNLPVLNFVFRTAGAVPIAAQHEDRAIYEQAFARIKAYLEAGEVVCIFPEGKLTTTGELNEFKGGVELILRDTPVPVIPLALRGLWGSFFSRDPARRPFRRIWSRVTLVAGEPLAPDTDRLTLQQRVAELRGAAL